MNFPIRLAAALALSTAALCARAEGVTFNKPVTYSQPVTYAAGVTYLAAVTYAQQAQVAPTPVRLEGLVVTPRRTYRKSEWLALQAARAEQRRHAQHRWLAPVDWLRTATSRPVRTMTTPGLR